MTAVLSEWICGSRRPNGRRALWPAHAEAVRESEHRRERFKLTGVSEGI